MKLKTGIFIVLLVVLVACAGYINSKVDAYGYDTNFTLETVYGDQGSLEGTEIRLLDEITDTCFWDTLVKFEDGRLITETSTEPQEDYIPHYVDYDENDDKNVIYCEDDLVSSIDNYIDYGYFVFDETKEMGDAIIASNKDELSIKPSDYCDHYQYNWTIIHNYNYWYLITGQKKSAGDEISGSVIVDENIAKFADFFKIPIVEDETYDVEKIVDDDNGPAEIYYNIDRSYDHEFFNLKMKSAFGNDKAFLCFDNRTSEGNRVDTTQIPGGYGVYSFDFASGVGGSESVAPDMDTLRVVLPLDENTIIKKMVISSDEKYLYVFTLEGKDLVLYIMNTESCEVAMKKVLWENMDEEIVPNYSDYAISGEINIYSPNELEMPESDLFFAAQDGKGFRIIKIDGKDVDVVFERDFDEKDDPERLGIYLAPSSSLKFNWDEGENKLTMAVLKHKFADDESVDELNKTVVLVYKDSEPVFAGKITSDIHDSLNLRNMDTLEEYTSWAEEGAIDYNKNPGGKDIGKYYWGEDDLEKITYLTSTRIYSVKNE